ncbi:hypothetical protein Hanom_Chr08g00744981 [Helianthus anomalus]
MQKLESVASIQNKTIDFRAFTYPRQSLYYVYVIYIIKNIILPENLEAGPIEYLFQFSIVSL